MSSNVPPSTASPEVSIIVPTLNEVLNISRLVPSIVDALKGNDIEVIVVDDMSTDGTADAVSEMEGKHPVRLISRKKENGLSGAVLRGLAEARGRIAIVMDADFQHPPESLPTLLEPLRSGQADFVIGSRHVGGASTDVSWGHFRRLNSWGARLLAAPLCRGVRDPMSGFFGLTRESWEGTRGLAPLGYKIALEFLAKNPCMRVSEVPIHFGLRAKGESKLSLREQFRYLEHLSRLYDFLFPRLSPIVKFCVTWLLTWLVALPVFLALNSLLWPLMLAVPAALLCSDMVHAMLHWRYLSTEGVAENVRSPWIGFMAMIAAELVVSIAAVSVLLHELIAPTPLKVFSLVILTTAICRYMLRKELRHDVRVLKAAVRAIRN